MLKTTVLLSVFVINKMPTANEIDGVEGDNELIEKCEKLSKTRKLFKFQILAKSKKKLLKNKNSPNFNAKENGPSFLTPKGRIAFNYL